MQKCFENHIMLGMFSNETIISCLPSEVIMDAQSKRKHFDTLTVTENLNTCIV